MGKIVWCDIGEIGSTVYSVDPPFDITYEMADSAIQAHYEITKPESGTGYEIPMAYRHKDTGLVFGLVREMRIFDGKLQAGLEILDSGLKQAYNEGTLRQFSPSWSLDFVHPSTGKQYMAVIDEVSFTSFPAQWNLRAMPELNETRLSMQLTNPIKNARNEMDELLQELKSLKKMIASLMSDEASKAPDMADEEEPKENVADMADPEKEEGEEKEQDFADGEDDSEEKKELSMLRAKVQKLEDDKLRVELSAKGVDEGAIDTLVKLNREGSSSYKAVYKMAIDAAAAPQEKGATGTLQNDFDVLIDQAKADGVDLSNKAKATIYFGRKVNNEQTLNELKNYLEKE